MNRPSSRASLELFLASFLMLFVELVVIRWAGAYVVYLSYFSNFVLLGSFLGIGLAFLRAKKRPDLFRWAPLLLLGFTAATQAQPVLIDRSGSDLIYFGSVTFHGLPAWLVLPFVFLATTAILAATAHGAAVRFHAFAPLDAYRLDILGSLAGVATFAVLAKLGAPPLAWAIVIAILFVILLDRWRIFQYLVLAGLIGVFGYSSFRPKQEWSPYYRVESLPQYIRVNGIPHQAMAKKIEGSFYQTPYQRLATTPREVMVIGAGNGNDVAAALAAGVAHVDAVEIDPVIQRFGARLHPAKPYSDPRVTPVNDDGRAYLERTPKKYDLIVFALPDSLTLVSGQSAVRLESYLFTREAIVAARERLAPGGVFAMYNFYRETWLLDRLAGTVRDVFGAAPCLELGPENPNKTVGRFAMFLASEQAGRFSCTTPWAPTAPTTTPVLAPATDDHPFVYLKESKVPTRYLLTLGLILAVSFVLIRVLGGKITNLKSGLDLFAMGAAFLLLETLSVVRFALLFGTTWYVNALVFLGILLAVYLAIEFERRRPERPTGKLFPWLFLGLALAIAIPGSLLLELSPVPRFLVAAALAFFPVFVANLVFARRFRTSTDPTSEFGANLLGAMAGGTLEYFSMVVGYRALLGVAGVLYALAWWLGKRRG